MKQKHLARLAAFSVGVTGGAAFGDDHLGDEITEAECDLLFPFDCNDVCKELADCLLDGDILDCWDELDGLTTCAFPPPSPPAPPPLLVCPAGQHFAEGGGCHADHECGDDEIGGGDADCEACPDGEIPNEDGTACVTCEHGESGESSGVCAADPCGPDALDQAAINALSGIPKESRERGTVISCKQNKVEVGAWSFSGLDKCNVSVGIPHSQSCYSGGSKETGCNLSGVHTHPWFTWPDANGLKCRHFTISSKAIAAEVNKAGMEFSQVDLDTLKSGGFSRGHLGVADRSCIQAATLIFTGSWTHGSINGACTLPADLPEP